MFEKIIFPYLKATKEELGYSKKQCSLIVMDTLKGQDNTEIKALCLKIDCKLVIMPHNLTNKFQSLDISINQKAKKFISPKFNTWYVDVKVSMKISALKPLHAHWIVNMYTYLKQQKDTTQNHREYGFFFAPYSPVFTESLCNSRSPYAIHGVLMQNFV